MKYIFNESAAARRGYLICCVLLLVTLGLFWPVLNDGFINLDDDRYVTENVHVRGGLTREAIRWAFTSGYASNWHPLTWISHMTDCEIFGLNPLGHHLTNLVFHIANALLLFGLLRQMTGAVWRSAVVAALFAWHPMHVETVAWVAERKDVLSTFFGLLALVAYGQYAASPKLQKPRSKVFYGLSLLFFTLSLLSKPMLVTLPFLMLLLDYWPLQRNTGLGKQILKPNTAPDGTNSIAWTQLVLEKAPYFLLAIASSAVTLWAQQEAASPLSILPLSARLGNALLSYLRYSGKLFWPQNLCLPYPHPLYWPAGLLAGAGLFVLAVSIAVILLARHRPYLLVGWLWFLGMLIPVIGVVQVGAQALADRYTYLPYVGLFIMVVWGIADLVNDLPWRRLLLVGTATAALLACLCLTRMQLRYWRNSVSLFEHSIAVSTNNWIALRCAASALADEGKYDEGVILIRQAITLVPTDAGSEGVLALWLTKQGKIEEGILHYRNALKLNPDLLNELNNLAWILATDPHESLRNGPEAVGFAEHACELTHYERPELVGTLAAAYAEAGRFKEAVETGTRVYDLCVASGSTKLAETNRKLLEIYKSGRPFHEAPGP